VSEGPIVTFPEGFLWGTATSAHQVEGGNRFNDWWRFERDGGRIADGSTSGDACRHWELFDSDFALSAADGHKAHRLSIEWSRIEPERGRIDAAAVDHYHAVFASLRRHGLVPVVTLHHFTNPTWLADAGGWEERTSVDRFCDFVRFCAREYGGEVDWWCTVNEPEVFAFRGWAEGTWPPGKRDDRAALAVIAHQLEAHALAYRILHQEDRADADGDGRPAIVGFAKQLPQLEPENAFNPLDGLRAWFEDRVFNRAVLDAPITGDIDLFIPGGGRIRRRIPELERAQDYVGINYYTRFMVRAHGRPSHVARRGSAMTDIGWEIHPEGFERAIRRAGRAGLPVVVTENGFADAADSFRSRALVDYLRHMAKAMAEGVRVAGYFHWSLMDNFEWAEGFAGRFGLYAVDFSDPSRKRIARESARIYSRIVKANAITPETAGLARGGSDAPRGG
jgi:beta-glucosidase